MGDAINRINSQRERGYLVKPAETAYANVKATNFAFWGAPVVEANDGTLSCPGYTGNTFASSPWDYLVLAVPYNSPDQPKTPGVCEVQCRRERSVDKKKPAGNNGARITIHGMQPAEVDIKLLIWTPDQLRWLNEIWRVVFPNGKGNPEAFDVDHPVLRQHDVKSLVFIGGGGPDAGPIAKTRIFTMKAIEYVPQQKKKATKTVVQSKGSVFDPKPLPTPGSAEKNKGP